MASYVGVVTNGAKCTPVFGQCVCQPLRSIAPDLCVIAEVLVPYALGDAMLEGTSNLHRIAAKSCACGLESI